MPERLDSVQIQLDSRAEPLVVSRAANDELILRLERHPGGAPVVDAFRAVGASSPVGLTIDEKGVLVTVIDEWTQAVVGGALPADVFELQNALIKDLHDAGHSP